MNPMPKKKPTRLKGVALKRLKREIIKRDGNRCGICRCFPPQGNSFTPHHVLYPYGPDEKDNMISACPECHDNVHDHRVWVNGGYIKLKDKPETQAWVRKRIKQIKEGMI